jgi:hypothetical protein
MTAALRTLPFGTAVKVCHDGCVVVRITIAARLSVGGISI